MFYGPEVHRFLCQLYEVVLKQDQKLDRLEIALQDLKRQLHEQQSQKKFVVEKIDYHFDQLKVEKLEGTLNIGLTPESGKSIEEFVVNGSPMTINNTDSHMDSVYTGINEEINRFLNQDAVEKIQEYEQKYQCIIGKELQEFMMKDINNQLQGRIQYYMGQYLNGDSKEALEKCKTRVLEKVKSDIIQALSQYMENSFSKGK